jgi:hypothetical protein
VDSAPKSYFVADADAVGLAEGCIRATDRRGRTELPESLARGALSKGLARNLGELPISFLPPFGNGTTRPKRARPWDRQGCAEPGSEEASRGRGTGRREESEAAGTERE